MLDTGIAADTDGRPNVIQESEKNDIIKITTEELEIVILFVHWPERKVYIGTNLSSELKRKLIKLLRANSNCFAWSHSEMTGISLEVMTH